LTSGEVAASAGDVPAGVQASIKKMIGYAVLTG
jgi:hypothetical protein